MADKSFLLPPPVVRSFKRDIKAFHAEENAIKRDEVRASQMTALRQFQRSLEKRLRLSDVGRMFEEMKDQV
jgi:hypothetical protein